jgi:general secretion pathway protein G
MAEMIHDQELRTGTLADGLDDAVDPKTNLSLGYDKRVDPWGFPYQYKNLRTNSGKGNGNARKDKYLKPVNSDFDLYSLGLDGKSQPSLTDQFSRDDVLRARDGGFFGTAEDFDP